MELKPLFDRVVLKPVAAEEVTKSGIVLTTAAQEKEKPQEAVVLAVGPGGVVDGKEVEMVVAVGERVVVSKYAGTELKCGAENFLIVKQGDILAKVLD